MSNTSLSPFERVNAYFTGDALATAADALRSYYAPNYRYTGSAFDRWATAGASPNRFTADDIVAVSMLSVNVPARASLALLDDTRYVELLTAVPVDASIWASPELLDDDGPAAALWSAVRQPEVGRVITSKLLAVKRPGLIPIYDQHVANALAIGDRTWAFWQHVARAPKASDLVKAIETLTRDVGIPTGISPLRIIDVVVWMNEHGANAPTDRSQEGAQLLT